MREDGEGRGTKVPVLCPFSHLHGRESKIGKSTCRGLRQVIIALGFEKDDLSMMV